MLESAKLQSDALEERVNHLFYTDCELKQLEDQLHALRGQLHKRQDTLVGQAKQELGITMTTHFENRLWVAQTSTH